MTVRVNYTQRGFTTKEDYEEWGGKSNDGGGYDPLRLTHAVVRCKNLSCLSASGNRWTISGIEQRDLEVNPMSCDDCGGKNLEIKYFKPNMLPVIYGDENHRNCNMYTDILNNWDKGLIHRNFAPQIELLRHPDNYYGAQNKALFVDLEEPMMNDEVKNSDGNDRTWADFPWLDVKVLDKTDFADPQLSIHKEEALPSIPTQAWIDANPRLIPSSSGDPTYYPIGERLLYSAIATGNPFIIQDQRIVRSSTGKITATYYSVSIPAGQVWNYDTRYTAEQKEIIDDWVASGQDFKRYKRKYPPIDQVLVPETLSSQFLVKEYESTVLYAGKWFTGEPAATEELYGTAEGCDCVYDYVSTTLLPDVPEELGIGFILPRLPLYINSGTGVGSDPSDGGTGYTTDRLLEILELHPWMGSLTVNTDGTFMVENTPYLTTVKKREGEDYDEVVVQPFLHKARNVVIPYRNCPPCLYQNNMIYSSLLYLITQVDMDDPIY